jgi:hypothetical protein
MTPTEGIEPKGGLGHRAIRWMLVSRQTGRLTVAQWPNVSLSIFIILIVGLHLFHARGGAGNLIHVLADVALLFWAADELFEESIRSGGSLAFSSSS